MPKGIPSKDANLALKWALSQVGVAENPPGSNHGLKIDKWGEDAIGVSGGFAWCACFVWNAYFRGAGVKLGVPLRALVLSWVQWAVANGYSVNRPYRGDVVAMDWGPGPDPTPDDHIGIIVRVLAIKPFGVFYCRTVEGNTGDAVRIRWRWFHRGSDAVFIRVK